MKHRLFASALAMTLLVGCTSGKVERAAERGPSGSVPAVPLVLENPLEAPSTKAPSTTVVVTTTTELATTTTVEPVTTTTELATTTTAFVLPPATKIVVAETKLLVPVVATTQKPLPTKPPPTQPPATKALIITSTAPLTTKPTVPAPTTTVVPAVGLGCNKIGATAGVLVCRRVNGRLVWADSISAATTAPVTVATPVTAPAKATTTTVVALGPVSGFDGKTIVLGNLGSRTHPAFGPVGRSIQGALEAHFAAINAKGGIAGKYPVRILFSETGYDASSAGEQYGRTRDSVVGYASILGTPIVGSLLAGLERDNVTASPASTDIEWSMHPVLMPVGTSYQAHAANASEYFWSQSGKDAPMCALSIAGAYGDSGVEGVQLAGKVAGGTVGPSVRVEATTANMVPAIQQLAAAGCRGVMLTTAPQQAIAAVVTGDRAGYRPRWVWMAPTWTDQVLTSATSKLLEDTSWVVGEGPSYRRDPSPETPGLYQLSLEAKASGNAWLFEQANVGALFGYCQAVAWERVLERAVANGDLSRVGIAKALREVGVVEFGGVVSAMDYSQPARLSSGSSSIFTVDASWLLGLRQVSVLSSKSAAAVRR
jgi:ABC-type branched-subunit amino acid transport system substrate-binding protein